jgi:hypothetical protein
VQRVFRLRSGDAEVRLPYTAHLIGSWPQLSRGLSRTARYTSQPDNASGVYEMVLTGAMPPGDSGEQPWSQDQVQLFKAWMDGGYRP